MFEGVSPRPIRRIHFVGIGGVSMSGLARVLQSYGYAVSGSDLKASATTAKLARMGINVTIDHDKAAVDGADLVVYTAAVRPDNPELERARELGLPVLTRADLLGLLMRRAKRGVAVAGTHGKTTTTAMVGVILQKAGLDPTVLIGGEVHELGGNARLGDPAILVAEACEFNGSFLSLNPWVAAVLNIDDDHLDYFHNLDTAVSFFRRFAELVPRRGALVLNFDDANVRSIVAGLEAEVITYGLGKTPRWQATDIDFGGTPHASFTVTLDRRPVARVNLLVPGLHNVSNSLAAMAVAERLGVRPEDSAESLAGFRGAHRRFEYKGNRGGVDIYDDYAHHPTAVRSTLQAARRLGAKRLFCVFQPHLYSRTKDLLGSFARELAAADHLVVTDIYAAREEDPGDVSSRDLARIIASSGADVHYIPDFEAIVDHLAARTRAGDVVMTMGAGDVYQVAERFLARPQGTLSPSDSVGG